MALWEPSFQHYSTSDFLSSYPLIQWLLDLVSRSGSDSRSLPLFKQDRDIDDVVLGDLDRCLDPPLNDSETLCWNMSWF